MDAFSCYGKYELSRVWVWWYIETVVSSMEDGRLYVRSTS
jgi:hypothetical protein